MQLDTAQKQNSTPVGVIATGKLRVASRLTQLSGRVASVGRIGQSGLSLTNDLLDRGN